jgi:1,2-dihydroxy-3-keto-5-methylthiopentene dioxygenase
MSVQREQAPANRNLQPPAQLRRPRGVAGGDACGPSEKPMAIVDVPNKNLRLTAVNEITDYLSSIGIDYARWTNLKQFSSDATDQEILDGYFEEIELLKQKGGYVTADVINIVPTTPGLDAMLGKFNKEHWHDEDEVRFIVKGHGLFHIAPEGGDVVSIEMEAGDMIRVPRGTRHWFNLCGDKTVRAIRLFQDVSGWAPQYTDSGIDADYQPLCFGVQYISQNF